MADILAAMLQGFASLLDPSVLLYMFVGILFGMTIGFIPGLSGNLALALLLPFVFKLDSAEALALLLGAHSVVVNGGSVTSILFGTPGSAINAATVIDGYPMTKRGEGARAVGAALTASALGGVIGAVSLALLIPFVQPIVMAFGPPEFFILSLAGVMFIAFVTSGNRLKGLIAGVFGLMLSFVGQEISTGTTRYTFGSMQLWDGISVVAVVIGVFAITEMIELGVSGGSIAKVDTKNLGNPWQGVKDVFRRWTLMVRSSLIGTGVGVVPGMGGEVATFLAYGQAVQTSKYPERFGQGEVDGVIAPESANNAKEGGSLLPTLAFGIPGSTGMAILLGAFYTIGIQPGKEMMTTNLYLVFSMVFILIIAQVLASVIAFNLTKPMAKLTVIPGAIMIPVIVVLSMTGAFAGENSFVAIVIATVAGVVGYYMKKYGYSRPALVLGLVLGVVTEQYLILSYNLFQWGFMLRPIVIILLLGVLAMFVAPLIRKRTKRNKEDGVVS